jgi:hypothetical protein
VPTAQTIKTSDALPSADAEQRLKPELLAVPRSRPSLATRTLRGFAFNRIGALCG